MVMKEKDEELTLFLEMRRREIEREKNNLLLNSSADGPEAPLGLGSNSYGGGSPVSKKMILSSIVPPPRKTAAERFLDSENDKSDYDWLLTPPGTPLFPSLEMESQKTAVSQIGMSNVRPTALKSRLTNIQEEPASRTNAASKGTTFPSGGLNSMGAGNRRSTSAGSRTATPTGRPSLSATAKPSRPSTPTSRPTLSSTKSVAPVRSSTPTRTTARSSTPSTRPSLPGSKSKSRSATPTRQSSTPPSATSVAAAPGQSSSVTKSVPATLKNPVPSRGISPTVKSRPWKPQEIPGYSLDAPPNLRTSLPERPASASRDRPGGPSARPASISSDRTGGPSARPASALRERPGGQSARPASVSRERPGGQSARPASASRERPGGPSARPASASRGRPGGPSARSSSTDAGSTGRPRQQSCSPSRGRAPNGNAHGNRISILSRSRTQTNGSDDVNPGLMGTKMVERVVNMRKLAPPKQDDHQLTLNSSAGKSSSLDSTGFGRTLSKKSLDMALRHMDIRRSISGNLRPLMTNIPASSMYSVRSGGSSKGRTVDSPLATSSNASSELSVNNNSFFVDGIEMEDNEFGSERGNSSPSSQHGR